MNPITMRLVADKYIRLALGGNINGEDVTTYSVMPDYKEGEVRLICKENGVITGLQIFEHVFMLLDPQTRVDFLIKGRNKATNGQLMREVYGDIHILLLGEQAALGYLQRMNGIATYTRSVADVLGGSKTCLVNTRKTTPCMWVLEKCAVLVGGRKNRHYNLSDGVPLKDNHIDAADGVKQAIEAAGRHTPFTHKTGVGAENPDMVKEAAKAGADIIVLDSMALAQMEETMQLIGGRAETECSGNATKESIELVEDLGVNYVSNGALTHSTPILDVSLKHLSVLGE